MRNTIGDVTEQHYRRFCAVSKIKDVHLSSASDIFIHVACS